MSAMGKLVIVAGVLFDATADAVWDKAETLLWARPDARLHFCHVIGRTAIEAESHDEPSLVDEALKKLHGWVSEKAGGEDSPLGMQIHLEVAIGADPADELVQAAVDADADLILLGSHHRKAVARMVLGSVAEKVLHRAPCSVLIAQTTSYDGFAKSPAIAPAPEPGHKAYRPHPSGARSSVSFSSYDSAIYPTGTSRSTIR
jgi:nucleotide-binding universal stress UspA family protein